MLSVNSRNYNSSISQPQIRATEQSSTEVENKPAASELPNSYSYIPSFKGKIPNKLISEGNIKEKVEKLDILNDSEGLDKLLKEYTDDMDKCTLAETYREYDNTVKFVNKKWECLLDKMNSLCSHEDKEISQKADDIFGEKFMPAMLHFQEVFSKMDNSPVIRQGYEEELNAAKAISKK